MRAHTHTRISEKVEKVVTAKKVPGSVQAGLAFAVPEILEFKALRDSGKSSSIFPRIFPQFSSGTPEQIPETATAFLSFLTVVESLSALSLYMSLSIFLFMFAKLLLHCLCDFSVKRALA